MGPCVAVSASIGIVSAGGGGLEEWMAMSDGGPGSIAEEVTLRNR